MAELACMRCGIEGPGVVMRPAFLEDEAAEDGEPLGRVTVAVPTIEGPRGPRGMDIVEVPARYGYEPRCRDRRSCRNRAAAAKRPLPTGAPAAAPAPVAEPEEEEAVPWWNR